MASRALRAKRKTFNPMGIGILRAGSSTAPKIAPFAIFKKSHYIDVINQSDTGFCLRTALLLSADMRFFLELYNDREDTWEHYHCKGIWIKKEPGQDNLFLVGCQYHKAELEQTWPDRVNEREIPSPEDFSFIRTTRFFNAIDRGGLCPFLNSLTFCQVPAGQVFITQGDKDNNCYLIQQGTCALYVEKAGKQYEVNQLSPGDIIGEMALLTGEESRSTVISKSEMQLWAIEKKTFDHLLYSYPDVRNFITELVAEGFANSMEMTDRKVGKYTIVSPVSTGGYALVYAGRHEYLNFPVAIKMMKHDMTMEKYFLENFRNEARMAARLNHPNIVKVYDIEEGFQTIFIIMELLKGESLEKRLEKQTTLAHEEITALLIQICKGLKYAHEKGIVHQDIKPANILITSNNSVKILDFGLACKLYAENIDSKGTPYYMSPEQIEMEAVDGRSDIYSLGIMAYEMALGTRPFPENDLLKLMDCHVKEEIPDPWQEDPCIPAKLRNFIIKACRRSRDERYQNISVALTDLKQIGFKQSPRDLEKRRKTALFLFSKTTHQQDLNRLMEEITCRARDLGIIVRTEDETDTDHDGSRPPG